MDINDMLQLPLYLQISLGSGFLSYIIAQHGRRKDEQAVDLLFGVIAFSLPGLFVWMYLQSAGYAIYQTCFLTAVANLGMGLFWRKMGKRVWYKLMNQTRISNDEGIKNTWQRLIQDTTITPTQLFVTTKDGKQLSCFDILKYKDAAIPGWSIDDDGNVAMLVDRMDEQELSDNVQNEEWGDLITYIPSAEIHSVEFRFKKV